MEILQMMLIGVTVSYIGTLPPGIINMQSIRYQIDFGSTSAKTFIIGAVVFEFFQVLISVIFLNYLSTIFDVNILIFHGIALGVLFLLCISCIIQYRSRTGKNKEIQPRITKQNFLINGMRLAFLNVLIYPFYISIGIYLINYQITEGSILLWVIFSIGTTIGTYLCLITYLKMGTQIIKNIPNAYQRIYLVLILVFLILVFLQMMVISSLI